MNSPNYYPYYKKSIQDTPGKVVRTYGDRDLPNHANFGMKVMLGRNDHKFPLKLTAAEFTSVVRIAPEFN